MRDVCRVVLGLALERRYDTRNVLFGKPTTVRQGRPNDKTGQARRTVGSTVCSWAAWKGLSRRVCEV
jgi:hypothetical protein